MMLLAGSWMEKKNDDERHAGGIWARGMM